MSNALDFTRLSNMIDAVASRKFVALASTLTSSTGYLTGLVTTASTKATAAATSATTAQASAADAASAAASSLTVLNRFTSTYLGVLSSDPKKSSLGNAIVVGAFYVRASDGRFRFCNALAGNGDPIFADATVSADSTSIINAAKAYFLSLSSATLQTVSGAVTFAGAVTGPRVTDWASLQLVTAADLQDRLVASGGSVSAETTRAQTAEAALDSAKVNRVGDTMTGALIVQGASENPSVHVKNTTANRIYRIHAHDDGRFRIVDNTSTAERLTISTTGVVTIPGSLLVSVGATVTDLAVNRSDANDPGINFQQSGVSRWQMRRSVSGTRLYVARMNSSGVYVDSPWYINESDGAVVQNATTVNGILAVKGTIRSDAAGANAILNNTSGALDTTVQFQQAGVTRWTVGRSYGNSIFYINRYSDTGVFQNTPFYITENTGTVAITNGLVVSGTAVVSTAVQTPYVITTSNNAGTNVKIGDDCWIGDVALGDGFGVRGQGVSANGFITFGDANSVVVGCQGNDGIFRVNGNPVYHSGNIGTLCSSGSTTDSYGNSYWFRVGPDGFVTQGGHYRQYLASGTTIALTLLKPLTTEPLSCLATPYDPSTSYRQTHPAYAGGNGNTVYFRGVADDSGGGSVPFDWVCYGFAA